jgi:hypothetical protein
MTSLFGQGWHAPPAHEAPVAQAFPQALQLFGSVCSSTQAPAPAPSPPGVATAPVQSVSPLGQAHLPEMQDAPVSHTKPQAPQLFGSVVVFTQPAAPHEVSPVPQTHAVTLPVV